MTKRHFGIHGQALYVPPFRVSLEDWCEWTQNPWTKVRKVVGSGFRVPGLHENVYTMAANAALRLIENYDIDPRKIGFLALGTESSTDNAIGAVIVKGMINEGLKKLDMPLLPNECEVPEIKQACLAGVYALKAAIRYLAMDGAGKQAIVLSSDIASYERGSTGEQTQGAGAVAQWVCENPQLLEVQLQNAGTASQYRGLDFRKPAKRYLSEQYAPNKVHLHDFPVFNGKFSTNCFVDATIKALDSMTKKLEVSLEDYLTHVSFVFAHRPYQRMPETSLGMAYLTHLAQTETNREAFNKLAGTAGLNADVIRNEVGAQQELSCFGTVDAVHSTPTPNLTKLLRTFRENTEYQELVCAKLRLGADTVSELGNLYTASLPAWVGAGLEDAHRQNLEIQHEAILALGYGSGDAAEAIPMCVPSNWRKSATRLNNQKALQNSIDLTQTQYHDLHAGRPINLEYEPKHEFFIKHVGKGAVENINDIGVDFYDFKV